jgi:hypothetical protein
MKTGSGQELSCSFPTPAEYCRALGHALIGSPRFRFRLDQAEKRARETRRYTPQIAELTFLDVAALASSGRLTRDEGRAGAWSEKALGGLASDEGNRHARDHTRQILHLSRQWFGHELAANWLHDCTRGVATLSVPPPEAASWPVPPGPVASTWIANVKGASWSPSGLSAERAHQRWRAFIR